MSKYEILPEIQETINDHIKNHTGIDILVDSGDITLSKLSISNEYEASNAIGLFMNFDIKGAFFTDSFWFAAKHDNYIDIATYDTNGCLMGYLYIYNDDWYTKYEPLMKCFINRCIEIYGIKMSNWYYDNNNNWHFGSTTSEKDIPKMNLLF